MERNDTFDAAASSVFGSRFTALPESGLTVGALVDALMAAAEGDRDRLVAISGPEDEAFDLHSVFPFGTGVVLATSV